MPHQLKHRVVEQVLHVAARSGVEIVDAQDFIAALKQTLAEMRANKSGATGDENASLGQHECSPNRSPPTTKCFFIKNAPGL
jgi:hypothetical protein